MYDLFLNFLTRLFPPTIVYIVGKHIDTEDGWEFIGVFYSERDADEACLSEQYFLGPAELGVAYHDSYERWPGAYHPRAEDYILDQELDYEDAAYGL